MSEDIDQLDKVRTPSGVRPITDVRRGRLRIPDMQARQTADDPPMFVRSRFGWDVQEVSGSLGDLGTFLPHIVGAITVVRMDPTGILTTFGLFYALSGAFYGMPMAVQPIKAASAAVLIEPMNPGAIAGVGLVIGAFFLLIGVTGIVSRIARVLPSTIAAGLQLGLGLSLDALGIRLMHGQLWLGVAISALMLVLMRYKRMPVALIAVVTASLSASFSVLRRRYRCWISGCICRT
jgi:Molybdate transporter of MFS superfamily